jgi:MFS family permease
MFRDPLLSASLASSALVATVMMSTLVVGPFYLTQGLGLAAPMVGLALSVGPLVVAFTGVPAGRLADRWGAQRISLWGLAGMAGGALLLSLLPPSLGVTGYVSAIAILTAGYGLFQTANNTAVMAPIATEQRGLVSGLLNLARNLGLISGASLMGAVFAMASHAEDIGTAPPESLANGMRMTFAVAAALLLAALAIAQAGRVQAASPA